MQSGKQIARFSYPGQVPIDAGMMGVTERELLERAPQFESYNGSSIRGYDFRADRRGREQVAGSGGNTGYFYTPISPDDVFHFGKQNQERVRVLQQDGVVQALVLAGSDKDVDQVRQMIRGFAESGAVFLPDVGMQETGYWNPAIVTGDDGTATVDVYRPRPLHGLGPCRERNHDGDAGR